MKPFTLLSLATAAFAVAIHAAEPKPVDAYNVVWPSPSENQHGSMPLGNGDIALNTWITQEGDLQFYISKSDTWDDNARLVKVGKVRIRFTPNPIAAGGAFRQELKLSEGAILISTATNGSLGASQPAAVIRVWVDANHPVIHVTADSVAPLEATAFIELWRTNQQQVTEFETSDVLKDQPAIDRKRPVMTIEPDRVLAGQRGRVGWLHHNTKSVGPELLAETQGLTGFKQPDPLLHRTFGAVITAARGERLDDLRVRSPAANSHRFSIFVLTRHPSTPEQWHADMDQLIRATELQSFETRWDAHATWWNRFWDRSWIRATARKDAAPAASSIAPENKHAMRIGMDQGGGNKFAGELGRMSVYDRPMTGSEVAAMAAMGPNAVSAPALKALFSGTNFSPHAVSNSAEWKFGPGFTLEAWVRPQKLAASGARLFDKITPGGSDGFLLDTFPRNSLRLICGETILQRNDALPAGQWSHVAAVADSAADDCRLYVNGQLAARADGRGAIAGDEAAYISQMYHLQRFITACAGRGNYPIKFNGSLFTVPPGPSEKDPDYRRWGPGYWWQNTRLPYMSLCASGDFDLQRPLFRMYAEQLLPLCKYRTKLYLGHDGAYIPECVMFWGAVFSETYGWTPFEQRQDKLQSSRWHKWEWVGGLELSWMMLDYFDHLQDREFLQQTALPFTREILTFFEQHYPLNSQGQLVMHPSQALETWWRCTNAAPELAGCIAITERVLALPAGLASASDRETARRLRGKLPPLPTREINGRKALAPAAFFAEKSNIENPELYSVFPFRLFAFNRPNPDWALAALEHRGDRGHNGWRQDDIFMAYLGLTEDARNGLVSRAGSHDKGERFPAFWGPNYDWTPDQDHGGVMMKTFQSMLLQTDGQKIFLLPAWPGNWDVTFKLHAPQRTVLEGSFRNGAIVSLKTTPEFRRADVVLPP